MTTMSLGHYKHYEDADSFTSHNVPLRRRLYPHFTVDPNKLKQREGK